MTSSHSLSADASSQRKHFQRAVGEQQNRIAAMPKPDILPVIPNPRPKLTTRRTKSANTCEVIKDFERIMSFNSGVNHFLEKSGHHHTVSSAILPAVSQQAQAARSTEDYRLQRRRSEKEENGLSIKSFAEVRKPRQQFGPQKRSTSLLPSGEPRNLPVKRWSESQSPIICPTRGFLNDKKPPSVSPTIDVRKAATKALQKKILLRRPRMNEKCLRFGGDDERKSGEPSCEHRGVLAERKPVESHFCTTLQKL